MKIKLLLLLGILVFLFDSMILTKYLPKELAKKIVVDYYLSENKLFNGRFILKYKEEIGVSPVQEEKIEDMMLHFEEVAIKRGADIKIKELKLTSYIKSNEIEREKVANLIKEISNIKSVLVIEFLNYLLDLREVLSNKQLEKLKSLNDVLKSRIKNRLFRNNLNPGEKK